MGAACPLVHPVFVVALVVTLVVVLHGTSRAPQVTGP